MKNKRGITLVALIITIIVLLILAGVVISMTVGNDGIIGKAQSAVDMYKNTQEKEEVELAKINNEMEKQINGGRNLADETPGTATAADIIKGKTAWVNGNKVIGTLDEYFIIPGAGACAYYDKQTVFLGVYLPDLTNYNSVSIDSIKLESGTASSIGIFRISDGTMVLPLELSNIKKSYDISLLSGNDYQILVCGNRAWCIGYYNRYEYSS